MKKKLLPVFLILLFLLVGCKNPYDTEHFFGQNSNMLELHSIDVGQGDSTLILTPDGKTMLIDAGDNRFGNTVVRYLKDRGISHIDVLIATHADSDHIGGMDQVISSFSIGEFFMSSRKSDTKSFKDLLESAEKKNLPIQIALSGTPIDFDLKVQAMFLSPFDHTYLSSNQFSAVTYLRYGKHSFLLMGDAEILNEEEILHHYPNLTCDYLKIGHHGSKHSSSEMFIKKVRPRVAVISCGYKNPFFHPHKRVMKLLEEENIPVYRTDEQKDIIFFSDGTQLYTDAPSPASYDSPN